MNIVKKIFYLIFLSFNVFIPVKALRKKYRLNVKYFFYKPSKECLDKINIMTNEETLNYIIKNKCSYSRYGDGEIGYMLLDNFKHFFQPYNEELRQKLKEIFQKPIDSCLVGIPPWMKNPEIAINNVVLYHDKFKDFLKEDIVYGDSFSFVEDTKKNIDKIKQIWNDKNIIIVTGKNSAFIFDNRVFGNAKNISYIYTKAVDAYSEYKKIYNEIKAMYNKDTIVLLSLGITATVLAYDLSKIGIQTIDIGHITNYFLQAMGEAENIEKLRLANKYVDGVTDISQLLYKNK